MRKKDYELIAGAVYRTKVVATMDKNSVRRYAKGEALALMATDLAATLSHADPKFDRQEFLAACGIQTLEQDIKEVAELEAKLDSDPDWRAQSATDNRECWTCHKAVSVCGHSQPV